MGTDDYLFQRAVIFALGMMSAVLDGAGNAVVGLLDFHDIYLGYSEVKFRIGISEDSMPDIRKFIPHCRDSGREWAARAPYRQGTPR